MYENMYDICMNYFNQNKLRTLWGWNTRKNKNTEPQADFTGPCKKRVYRRNSVGLSATWKEIGFVTFVGLFFNTEERINMINLHSLLYNLLIVVHYLFL